MNLGPKAYSNAPITLPRVGDKHLPWFARFFKTTVITSCLGGEQTSQTVKSGIRPGDLVSFNYFVDREVCATGHPRVYLSAFDCSNELPLRDLVTGTEHMNFLCEDTHLENALVLRTENPLAKKSRDHLYVQILWRERPWWFTCRPEDVFGCAVASNHFFGFDFRGKSVCQMLHLTRYAQE